MSEVAQILEHCRTIAVVGLSPKVDRDSYRVSAYMQAQGYRIIPINPNAQTILGERCYATLSEAAQHESIDVVNCFRRSEDIPPIAQEAISIGARAIWLQLGIRAPQSLEATHAAGLWSVQDLCLMVEHRRWTRLSA
jgi:predicted CoA-binding protein